MVPSCPTSKIRLVRRSGNKVKVRMMDVWMGDFIGVCEDPSIFTMIFGVT
jgi:hypothetical protein